MGNQARMTTPTKPQTRRKRAKNLRRASAGDTEYSSGTTDQTLAALIRIEAETLELLKKVVASPPVDTLRPGLLQCLRLHECALHGLEALRKAHLPGQHIQSVMESDADEVIVVTDADIVVEQ